MVINRRSSRRSAHIRVPASSSNLGPAFDAVGIALQLYLTLDIEELPKGPPRLEFTGQDADLIPRGEMNLLWRTMREIAAEEGADLPPFSLRAENRIPITKGLGSSAAAVLGGVAATDFLCRLDLGRDRWLEAATAREGHPDNAAASIWGGIVASMTGEKIQCARAELPPGWTIIVVTPDFELETRAARAVLPAQVPHRDAVFNVQRTAFLMIQLLQGRREGLHEAMNDRLHQTYRSRLVPGLEEILAMRDSDGLLGVALSGAGPSVVAFADSHEGEIGEAIRAIFLRHGLESEVRLLEADNTGLTVTG